MEALNMPLEQGELIPDSDDGDVPAPAGEVKDLITSLQSTQKELTERIVELLTQVDAANSGLSWKKEGLKKQFDIAQSIVTKCQKAMSALRLQDGAAAKKQLQLGIDILSERMKELRIADSSDAGWETVNVYRSHPVADDSDDDRRIRKAEKLAKEKMQAKSRRNKPNRRFNPYRRPYFANDSFQPRSFPYRSFGSARSQDNAQRNTYVPDRRRSGNSNLCFFCGQAERRDRT